MKRDKIAIFMAGLPGSGKSTYIENNPDEFEGCKRIAADELRKEIPGYDGSVESDIKFHEQSVDMAEDAMYKAFADNTSVVMDAGAINNSYTPRIMNAAKEAGYFIKLVYINTPAHICIERISGRERKVPSDNVIWKSQRAKSKISVLRDIADDYKEVNYYTNEYYFFDMDGCIAAYENYDTNEAGDIDFFNASCFEYADPVGPTLHKIRYLNEMKGIPWNHFFIFSASPSSVANAEKLRWLEKNFPEMPKENITFVGNKAYKDLSLEQFLRRSKISKRSATYVEDDHSVIRKCKARGINCIHLSKFLS